MSVPPSSSGPPPGWYPDPEHPGQTRWWDGQEWAAALELSTGPVQGKPVYKRWGFILGIGALSVALVLLIMVISNLGLIMAGFVNEP